MKKFRSTVLPKVLFAALGGWLLTALHGPADTATLVFDTPSAPISFNFSYPHSLAGSTDITFNQLTNFTYQVTGGTFTPTTLTYNDNIFDFNTQAKTLDAFTLVSQSGILGFNLQPTASEFIFSGGPLENITFLGFTIVITGGSTGFEFTPGLTPNQNAVATYIDQQSLNAGNNLSGVILSLLTLPPNQLAAALDELSPQAFGEFTSTTAFNNASFETEAMDEYLANQRSGPNGTFVGGNGQLDASGLTINDPSYDPTLAMVHSRMMAWNPGLPDGTVSDLANPLMGGVDMRDSKDMKAMNTPPAYIDPWNFFVRGNVILAQGFSNQDVSHFDDNTESVVLGTDYRVSPNFLIGLTAGYGHTDVTLDDNGSSATVDSYSPGFYASYADHGWYADLTGSYVHNAYTQDRKIAFLGQDATSAPEGNEGVANLDGGYDFHCGSLTYGPLAGVQYTHLSVDGYNESGSIADLSVNEQDADSLRSRLGGRVSAAFSYFGVNFKPHLDASWQHEFMDQSRGITSQFQGQGLGSFSVKTVNPSRDSALADAGMDAELDKTWTVFTDYEVQAGQANYFGQSVQAGVKIGF
jgi:uncharacterized protein YhjY with autotransporter beta-barrel domain